MNLRDRFMHNHFSATRGLRREASARLRLHDPTLLVVMCAPPSDIGYSDYIQYGTSRHDKDRVSQARFWLCSLLDPPESLPSPWSREYDTHAYLVQCLSRIQLAAAAKDGMGYEEGAVFLPCLHSSRTRGVDDWSQPLP